MSAIFAAVGGEPLSAADLQRAVVEMAVRGAERLDCRVGEEAGLAAGRFEWEAEATPSGPLVADDGVRVAVLDGSLYYRDALRRAIAAAQRDRPIDLGGDSAIHLLLGAYRAWGADCARHLEGDFAFAIWDREAKVLTCARDVFGTRPLFYGRNRERVIVASMASTVARRTEHAGALDVRAIGESVSGAFNLGEDTAYMGVAVVPVGHTLVVSRGGKISLQSHWEAPPAGAVRASSFEEGAEELRELLIDAVDERLAERGPTALWLSGGWDSSALFACSQRVLGRRTTPREIALVSMSYPVGDVGREDEAILSVAERYGATVTWCQSHEVPLLPPDAATEAGQRDLPFAHAFEMWSRTMGVQSRALGARVVLTGTGGDELFAGTNLYLADLLRRGAWGSLALDWYRIRGRTLNGFRERVVQPALAASGSDANRSGPFEQKLLPWLRDDFVAQHRLRERERAAAPYGRYPTLSSTEQLWGITAPMFPKIRSTLAAAQMRAGIVSRSPFLDQRVLRFALGRPRNERVTARETKRLLRRAMKGLLPDEFLAPRPARTGITTQYMREQLQGPARAQLDAAFDRPMLGELGIVDAARLQSAWREYVQTGQGNPLSFYDVYQAEMWLRARLGTGNAQPTRAEAVENAAS